MNGVKEKTQKRLPKLLEAMLDRTVWIKIIMGRLGIFVLSIDAPVDSAV